MKMRETSRGVDKKLSVNNNQKTKMGAGLTYVHGKQLGYNAIVMAPAHLVRKWAREIEESVPNAKCVVVSHVSDVKALSSEIKNRAKNYNLYMIMSYESAKFNYYEMPCPVYKDVYNVMNENKTKIIQTHRNVYVCPKCGQVLSYEKKNGRGRNARTEIINLSHEDFTKQNANNMVCNNIVKVWNPKTNLPEDQKCNEALWRPISVEEELGEWVKLGELGWHRLSHIMQLAASYRMRMSPSQSDPSVLNGPPLTKKEADLSAKIDEALVKYENNTLKVRALIKYPLGKYIKHMFKKDIDYVVFDEVHKLSGKESLQGLAMGHLIQASRNAICLTGTLINGFADSLFYILYRMIPRTMQSKGYGYDKNQMFLRDYGSAKTTIAADDKKSSKKMPGVSPLLFTDYLLDTCAFIALDDVADGLPDYSEIPVGVELDAEVAQAYSDIKAAFRQNSGFRGLYPKTTTNFMNLLSTFPDMPYDQAPIADPDTNALVYQPPYLPNAIDMKLDATLEIVDRKIANGEKVLIYYTWTNITNVKDVLQAACEARGYKVAVLESKTKNTKREEWIEQRVEEGIDVLICNPSLVETGLDLLDFTTIIWYQLDYSVFTMRQASRRSWRLGQMHNIEVYFMYYHDTTQESILALMATKLQASTATEGKMSEEGLAAMSQNDDLTTQVTNSVMKGISNRVDISSFNTTKKINNSERIVVTTTENRRRLSRENLRFKKPYVARWYRFDKAKPKTSQSSDAIFDMLRTPLVNLFA